ncbi:MAG: hypothetical protein D0433_03310 [Candidatus Thermochlorobacter aerophilum]|uniref:Uncharacterized protein n=1 Tax=Candidatus Thermochlorobacter aerophilus TaxID=1868324 RepID=A0A395M2B9_9BACT|nr:MAG: hypothetical protein D0433_03310 [Candidatus Thermochlorobacter aerophilum]
MKLALIALLLCGSAAQGVAQIGGTAAPFARMGFAARGVGLGNAGAAVIAAVNFTLTTTLHLSALLITTTSHSHTPSCHGSVA